MRRSAPGCGSRPPAVARRRLRQTNEIARVYPAKPEVADSVALAAGNRVRFREQAATARKMRFSADFDGVRQARWSGRRALGSEKLLTACSRNQICLEKIAQLCAQSAGAASPSAPALYWIPIRSCPLAILNCGPSLIIAMSSTYWDSAEMGRIVTKILMARTFLLFAAGHRRRTRKP